MIGVHAPEFAFEREPANVAQAVAGPRHPLSRRARQRVRSSGRALKNNYWPAHYFIDAQGRHPLPPFRRGRLRRVRAGDPPAARRSRPCAQGRRRWPARSDRGAEAARGTRRHRLARDLHRLCAGATVSSRPAGSLRDAAEDLCRRSAVAQRLGARRAVGSTARQSARSLAPGREDSLPLPRPRPASRARLGARQAGALPRDARRQGARRRRRRGREAGRHRRGDRSSGSTSWSGRRATCATAPSRSNSSTPAPRPSPSPSAEPSARCPRSSRRSAIPDRGRGTAGWN